MPQKPAQPQGQRAAGQQPPVVREDLLTHPMVQALRAGGLQLARVELKDCGDEAEFGKRLKAFDEKTPKEK